MKIFYFGGQKSGKTKAGIKKALELTLDKKPYYVATYDNSYNDSFFLALHTLDIGDFFCCRKCKRFVISAALTPSVRLSAQTVIWHTARAVRIDAVNQQRKEDEYESYDTTT